uniref:Uncharacterized protein n=1 Tax=Magnetococcus massalia (strain MO-1) TaxID=451514 RepID=A0A1S7LCY8_MAGMO|nr:Protein of unknown function [Candidatus Magnetococcus massalia]
MKDNRYAAPCCALAALWRPMDRTQKNHYAHRSIGHHALPSLAWNSLPATLHEISGLRIRYSEKDKKYWFPAVGKKRKNIWTFCNPMKKRGHASAWPL